MNETRRDLTPQQIGAIMRSIRLGRTLQQEHPEIADLYRRGYHIRRIVEEIDIKSEYDVTERVAWNGVYYAISGSHGFLETANYEEIIPEDERERLGAKHLSESSSKNGRRSYEEKKGIHAQTTEEKRELGRRMYEKRDGLFGMSKKQRQRLGLESGRRLYEEKRGIHALTPEEKKEAGRLGSISRGQTIWSEEEKREAYELSLTPEYKKGSLIKNNKIAERLNRTYHEGKNIRSPNAVSSHIWKYRRSLENKVDEENQ